MKVRKSQIDTFFTDKKFAIAGVSRNSKKFGCTVFNELRKNGYDILPVNPNAEKIEGVDCYKTVKDLPDEINSLLICTPKGQTDEVLQDAIDKGIKNIWVQQGSSTDQTLKISTENQKEIIHNKCIFMFAEPVVSIHKFHRGIVKFFGGLPKD